MDGSPSAIITLGFGNGTFAPEIGLLPTLGFGVGEAVVVNNVAEILCQVSMSPSISGAAPFLEPSLIASRNFLEPSIRAKVS